MITPGLETLIQPQLNDPVIDQISNFYPKLKKLEKQYRIKRSISKKDYTASLDKLKKEFDDIIYNRFNFHMEIKPSFTFATFPIHNTDKISGAIAFEELLKDSKIKIMFVLFEMEYYSHIDKYKYIMSSLKEFGVLFAIDRVGSIHTSFLYLRELNIDLIRFDTYYSHEDKLKKNRSIIEGFNLIAEQKNIKSWIKNIEDEATFAIAKEINIDYIQGKYLSELQEIRRK